MAYTKTAWVDGSAPAITAAQLNRIETGVDDAHAGDLDAGAIGTVELANGAVTPVKTSFAASLPAAAGLFAGWFNAIMTAGTFPSGWVPSKIATGQYRLTHSFGTLAYAATATVDNNSGFARTEKTLNYVDIFTYNTSGTAADRAASFIIVKLA